MYKKIFLLFVVNCILFAQYYDYPPHNIVLDNNLKVVASGPHKEFCPSDIPRTKISLTNPFYCTYFKIGATNPSVSERVSALKPIKIFWVWGEEYEKKYEIELTPNPCGTPIVYHYAIDKPYLEGQILIKIGDKTISYSISKQSQPQDPIEIVLSKQEAEGLRTLKRENNNPILPKLEIELSGEIKILYHIVEIDYIAIMTKEGLKCEVKRTEYDRLFSRAVSDKKTFDVEHATPIFLLLWPIDNDQLANNPKIKFSFLANQKANQISFDTQSTYASDLVKFAKYKIEEDLLSFQRIEREDLSAPLPLKNLGTNYTNKFLNSSPFSTSPNYAYQYFLWANLPPKLGLENYKFYFLDEFENKFEYNKDLTFRAAIGILNNQTKKIVSTEKEINDLVIIEKDFYKEIKTSLNNRPTIELNEIRLQKNFFYLPTLIFFLFVGFIIFKFESRFSF